jgi:hypothetical protein
MKKKIIAGILFLMLVSTMVVSATNIDVKENHINRTVVVDDSADVPVWEVGDSWTYNEHYYECSYRKDGTIGASWRHNCTSTYTVIDDTGDTYKVELTSENNEGSTTFGKNQLRHTQFTKLKQVLEHRKTDLAYVRIFHQVKGPVFWLIGKIGIPIPAQYSLDAEWTCEPANELFPFPITQGKTGTFSSFTNIGHQKVSLFFGLIKLGDSDFSYENSARDYSCEMDSITVPAGTYDAYKISRDMGGEQNYSYLYYVPEVGFYAKVSSHLEKDDSGKPVLNYEHELVSTTYKQ